MTLVTNRVALVITAAAALFAQPAFSAAPATTQPTIEQLWQPGSFDYARPSPIIIEQSTPTPAQLAFHSRPPQLPGDKVAIKPATAKPARVSGIDILRLRFNDIDGDCVPLLLCTPATGKGPFPLVVAVHGMNSNKAQVCGQLAPALAQLGFAVLAPDMPLHGERPGTPRDLMANQDLLGAIQLHHRAIIDIRETIDVAETLSNLDLSHGVILAGYSMGSWLDSIAGPADGRVKAMVLMVGGATETTGLLHIIPQLACADPLLGLPHFAGPLLMLNGQRDAIVTPDMATRLFTAAAEPKSQRWYDSGHLLPEGAYKDAAEWIGRTYTQLSGIERATNVTK